MGTMSLNEEAGENEEGEEFLVELDVRIRASEGGARTYSIEETCNLVREVCKNA